MQMLLVFLIVIFLTKIIKLNVVLVIKLIMELEKKLQNVFILILILIYMIMIPNSFVINFAHKIYLL